MDREILTPLIEKILCYASRPEEENKKALWAEHQALLKPGKIPVCVYYEGIPGEQWSFMLGRDFLKCVSETAREIEFNLRRILWMAQNVPDDHIVWPFVKVSVPMRTVREWGVDLSLVHSTDTLGAKAFAAPFKDGFDLGKLTEPLFEIDTPAWEKKQEEARALCGGMLRVVPWYHNLEFSPFDVVANMRGLENIMMDAVDYPEEIHALMTFVTNAMEKHHLERERRGWINFFPSPDGKYNAVPGHRVHCAFLPKTETASDSNPKLRYEWPYISAQTSSGYGPEMFREFAHDYHCRLARHFPLSTVYYHGCEPLNQKARIIKELPNLRRFHVSPWTDLPGIVRELGGKAVLEVHSHPANVLMSWTEREMRGEIRRLVSEAEGHPMDLNLSDIHSVNGDPARLGEWARIAQEEAI